MANIYITGGTGFIGRNLIPLLQSLGHNCFVITRNPFSFTQPSFSLQYLKCDLLHCDNFEKLFKVAKPDLLIHLAWDVKSQDFSSSAVNQLWLDQSIHLCKSFFISGGRKVIVAGTCFEYDLSKNTILSENSFCAPTTLYGKCKEILYKTICKLCKEYSTSFVWTRIFYPYGPGEEKRKIISHVLNNLKNGQLVNIKTPNDVIDYIHVTDISRALALLVSSNTSGTYNICSGKGTKLRKIVEFIAKKCDKEDLLLFDNNNESSKFIVGDNGKLSKLGFNCKYDIYQGIDTYF